MQVVLIVLLYKHRCVDSCRNCMLAYTDTVSCMIAINLCYTIFITAELRENVHMCMSTCIPDHFFYPEAQDGNRIITHFINALSHAQLYFVLLLVMQPV